MRYDMAVIGNDEAAFEMVALATGAGRRILAVLPEVRHSAWFVGQALRRLVSDLIVDQSRQRQQIFARAARPRLLQTLIAGAVARDLRERLQRWELLGVDALIGEARFATRRRLQVMRTGGHHSDIGDVGQIVIGTGVRRTAMHRPLGQTPFHPPESIFCGRRLPRAVCVLGGDDFGAGLAALMSLFGVETRLVAREDQSSVMLELATAAGVQVGHHPADVGLPLPGPEGFHNRLPVVDCRRVTGFSDHLNLAAIGVEPDENGQLWCASSFETWCPGVFGVGSIVGFSPDSALHPLAQAERIMHRVSQTQRVSAPYLRSRLVAATFTEDLAEGRTMREQPRSPLVVPSGR